MIEGIFFDNQQNGNPLALTVMRNTQACMQTQACLHIHMYIHTYTHTHIRMHAYTLICTHVCTHIHLYLYIYKQA